MRCPTENGFNNLTKIPVRPSTFYCIMVCCMGETIYTSQKQKDSYIERNPSGELWIQQMSCTLRQMVLLSEALNNLAQSTV